MTSEIGRQTRSVEDDRIGFDALWFSAKMERDAMRLVQRSNESTEMLANDARQRNALGRDHIDWDIART